MPKPLWHGLLSILAVQLILGVASPPWAAAATVTSHTTSSREQDHDLEAQILQNAKPIQACQFAFLKKVGWSLTRTEKSSLWHHPSLSYGKPCERESFKHAKEQGDLTIQLPQTTSERSVSHLLNHLETLVSHPATQCGYKIKLAEALQKGVQKLANNKNYVFREERGGFTDLPSEDWSASNGELTCMLASSSPSQAIESFYNKPCKAECCIGVQVGYWSGQYELYGAQDFDQAFKPEELTLATWPILSKSQGMLRAISGSSKEALKDPKGKGHSKLGHFSFSGLTGAFHNTLGLDYVDTKNDHNENFVIVQMSPKAGERIRSVGGIPKLNQINTKIWKLSVALSKALRENSDLLLGRIAIPKQLKTQEHSALEKIRALLEDPFLSETIVYVHDLKEMSFAEHLVRQIRINPRTPYHIRFYPDVDLGVFYERYLDYSIKRCIAESEARENAMIP